MDTATTTTLPSGLAMGRPAPARAPPWLAGGAGAFGGVDLFIMTL